jgi:hypothetical protein
VFLQVESSCTGAANLTLGGFVSISGAAGGSC